jgi:hypothetical protein
MTLVVLLDCIVVVEFDNKKVLCEKSLQSILKGSLWVLNAIVLVTATHLWFIFRLGAMQI